VALKTNLSLPFLRQYDKFIVVAVLVVLLISLFYLTRAGAARKQEEADYDRQLNALKPAVVSAQAMDMSAYDAGVRLIRMPFQLDKDQALQSGFMTPERRVSCVNVACKKPIPYAAEKCPFCGTKQPVAPELNTERDSDKDGIPDRVELALGLNPQDPSDAKGDLDNDGFSNLEEFLAKTDPKDPKSHPALVVLLRVKELRGKRLPLIFSGVNTMPNGQKQLVFNLVGAQARTVWLKEGDQIGDTGYVIKKVEIKSEEHENPNMPGIKTRKDVSSVLIKRLSDNKEVTLRINEGGKATDVEAVIVLTLDNSEYTVLENGTFKVRDETYRVISIDSAATSVVIENVSNGQQKIVRKLD
jgi:hypothetical protein